MDFRPDDYYRASLERIEQARGLYRDGSSFALSIYVAGLAVECMLRAFKLRRDPAFDERHDLLLLFRSSGMMDVDQDRLRAEGLSNAQVEGYLRDLRAALGEVGTLWSNRYRYASENQLRTHLKRTTDYRKIKGDYLKAMALRVLNAAQEFINKGVMQWPFTAN